MCGSQRGWGIKQDPPPHTHHIYSSALPTSLQCHGAFTHSQGVLERLPRLGAGRGDTATCTHTHTHTAPSLGEAGPGSPHPAKILEVEAAWLAQLTAWIIHTTKCSWGISALLGAASAGSPPCCWYFQHVPAPFQPLGEAVPRGCSAPCKPPHTPGALGTHLRMGLGVSLKPCALNPQDWVLSAPPQPSSPRIEIWGAFRALLGLHRRLHADKAHPAPSLATEGAKTSPWV